MAEFPALPLWTDAYLADTTHLSNAEHGSYLLLLIVAWRTGATTLPDDDKLLAKYARCSARHWPAMRAALEPFFVVSGGQWAQKRLQDEKSHVTERREAAAANGRRSALKRKGRHSTERIAPLERSDQQTFNGMSTPTPTPTPIVIRDKSPITTRGKKTPVEVAAKPDEVEAQVWTDFLELRKKKGAPVTQTALAGIEREAAKAGISLNAALAECCVRGWQGFKADWHNGGSNEGNRSGSNARPRRESGWTGVLRSVSGENASDDD